MQHESSGSHQSRERPQTRAADYRPGRGSPLRRCLPSVEEATEDAARRAIDFAVARTSLDREEAYTLLSIIGELRIGTSLRPVMATRLIVPEEQLRAAGWKGELP